MKTIARVYRRLHEKLEIENWDGWRWVLGGLGLGLESVVLVLDR